MQIVPEVVNTTVEETSIPLKSKEEAKGDIGIMENQMQVEEYDIESMEKEKGTSLSY